MELLELLGYVKWLTNPLVLGLVLGAFLGWNLPQPRLAKLLQDKLVVLWGKLVAAVKNR